jgi:hypothetical protein
LDGVGDGGGPARAAIAKTGARWWDLAAAWAAFLFLDVVSAFAPARSLNAVSLTIFWAFFATTLIVLCDQIALRLQNRSLLLENTVDKRAWSMLLAIGALSGLMLDGGGQWLGKLWIYPFWNAGMYAATFVVGFAGYWMAIAESYVAVSAILRTWRRGPRMRGAVGPDRHKLFRVAGVAGVALAAGGIALAADAYRRMGGYDFDIRTPTVLRAPLSSLLLTCSGLWLVLEWAQHSHGRESFLSCLLNGDRIPLYAMLLASEAFGILWEAVNSAHHFWRYTNWPLADVQLFGAPVAVLLSSPLQYLMFLSLGFLLDRSVWR